MVKAEQEATLVSMLEADGKQILPEYAFMKNGILNMSPAHSILTIANSIFQTLSSTVCSMSLKGYMNEKSKSKLDTFVSMYPNITLKIIGPNEYNDLKLKYKQLINWEE